MTYASLPTTGQTLGNTRDQIRQNFDIIKTAQSVNHVTFDLADQGKHKFLQMPEQAAAPTTAVNEGGFYTKDSGGTNIFFRSESSGNEYKITAVNDAEFTEFATNTLYDATPQNQNGGWTFLPGGLILMYGLAENVASGNGTIRFPRSFSLAPYSIQLTFKTNGTDDKVLYVRNIAQAANEMYIRNTSGSARDVYWTAIGPA